MADVRVGVVRALLASLAQAVFRVNSSQVNTLLMAKSQTRSKQSKNMQKFCSGYSERGVLLPFLTSGGE
jgi:hypothetical protein